MDKGGNPKVLIAVPEIKAFRIKSDHDFIILACDGIYDKLTSETSVPSGFAKAMKDQNINIDDMTLDQYRTGVVGVFVEQTLQNYAF